MNTQSQPTNTSFRFQLAWLELAKRYLLSILMVAVAMGLWLALEAWVGHGLPPYITFYPAMVVVVVFMGLGPGILATGLMALMLAMRSCRQSASSSSHHPRIV